MQSEFMDKARENLAAAEICLENNLFNASANRAYYAGFHAAVCALMARGIKKDKLDHKWVQAEFCGRLIKRRKVYPAKVKAHLMDMQNIRNLADYKMQKIGRNTARKQLLMARELISLVGKELSK